MKKNKYIFFAVMFVLILSACIFAEAAEYKNEVGVGISFGSESKGPFTVSSTGAINVTDYTNGEVLYTSLPSETLSVEMGATGFAAWEKFDASGRNKLLFTPAEGSTIFCNGTEYRGYIFAEKRTDGELLLINYVNIDDYVSSVLGKEMSYTWPIEALKAQAVCARNFVLTRGSYHKSYGFDVCMTTHCQVYGGVKSEHQNTRQAVEETSGVVATYNGKLVGLYFFATSGGATEDVENVWGSEYGYLRGVEDTYENPDKASRYSWTVNMTKSEIEEKLTNAGVSIGSLEKIKINSVSDTGRVLDMTFYGTDGEYNVKREKCRSILSLYSQKFTIRGEDTSSIFTTSGQTGDRIFALSSNGTKEIFSFAVLSDNGALSTVNADTSGSENYVITGGGYGHGVGMSQWGARGMAENGFNYEEILHHYFTDIELE